MKRTIIRALLLFMSLFLCSCVTNTKKDFVKVTFLTGPVETTVPFDVNSFKVVDKSDCDTIIIPEKHFSTIKRVLVEHGRDFKTMSCDERIYVLYDTIEVCFGDFNCPMYNNEHLDSVVYLIKSLSSYYNYFSIEELKEDPYIDKYGIPDTYKHIEEGYETPRREYVNVFLTPP